MDFGSFCEIQLKTFSLCEIYEPGRRIGWHCGINKIEVESCCKYTAQGETAFFSFVLIFLFVTLFRWGFSAKITFCLAFHSERIWDCVNHSLVLFSRSSSEKHKCNSLFLFWIYFFLGRFSFERFTWNVEVRWELALPREKKIGKRNRIRHIYEWMIEIVKGRRD